MGPALTGEGVSSSNSAMLLLSICELRVSIRGGRLLPAGDLEAGDAGNFPDVVSWLGLTSMREVFIAYSADGCLSAGSVTSICSLSSIFVTLIAPLLATGISPVILFCSGELGFQFEIVLAYLL